MFVCAQCGVNVFGVWDEGERRYEPISRYWKGLDISEAYCSAKCGLLRYEVKE